MVRVVFYNPGFSAIRYPDVIPSEKDEMTLCFVTENKTRTNISKFH